MPTSAAPGPAGSRYFFGVAPGGFFGLYGPIFVTLTWAGRGLCFAMVVPFLARSEVRTVPLG